MFVREHGTGVARRQTTRHHTSRHLHSYSHFLPALTLVLSCQHHLHRLDARHVQRPCAAHFPLSSHVPPHCHSVSCGTHTTWTWPTYVHHRAQHAPQLLLITCVSEYFEIRLSDGYSANVRLRPQQLAMNHVLNESSRAPISACCACQGHQKKPPRFWLDCAELKVFLYPVHALPIRIAIAKRTAPYHAEDPALRAYGIHDSTATRLQTVLRRCHSEYSESDHF